MNETIYETLQSLTALEGYPEWQPILDQVANSHNIDFANDEGCFFLKCFIEECIKNTQLYNGVIQKHQEEYEDVKNEMAELREENNHLAKMTQDLIGQMNDLKEFLEEADRFSSELRQKNHELATENAQLRSHFDEFRSESRPLTEENVSPRKQLEGLEDMVSDEVIDMMELKSRLLEKNGYIEALLKDFKALEDEKNKFEAIANAQKDYDNLKIEKDLEDAIIGLCEQYKKSSEGMNEMMAKRVNFMDDCDTADEKEVLPAGMINLESIDNSAVENDDRENKNLTLSKSLSCSPSKFSSHTKKQSLLFEAQMMSPDNKSLTERRKSTGRKNKSYQPFANLKVLPSHNINKSDQNIQESSTGQFGETESDQHDREPKSSFMIQSHDEGMETNRVVEKLDEVIGADNQSSPNAELDNNCSFFETDWGAGDFRGVSTDLLASPNLDRLQEEEPKVFHLDLGKAKMDYIQDFRAERSSSQPCVSEAEGKEEYERKLYSYREGKENKNINMSSMDFCGEKDLSTQKVIYEDNLESMTDVKSEEEGLGVRKESKGDNLDVPEQAQKDSALFKKKLYGEITTQTDDDLKEFSTKTNSAQKEDLTIAEKVFQEAGFQTEQVEMSAMETQTLMKEVDNLGVQTEAIMKEISDFALQTEAVKVNAIETQTLVKEVGDFALQTEGIKADTVETQTMNKEVGEIGLQTEEEIKKISKEFSTQTIEEIIKKVESVQIETQTIDKEIKEFCTQTNEDDNGIVRDKVKSSTIETQTSAKKLEENAFQTESSPVANTETQTLKKEVGDFGLQTEEYQTPKTLLPTQTDTDSLQKALQRDNSIQTEEPVVKKLIFSEGITQTNDKETKGNSTQTNIIKAKEKSMQTEEMKQESSPKSPRRRNSSVALKQATGILHRATQTDRIRHKKGTQNEVGPWRKNPKYGVLIAFVAPIVTVIALLLLFFFIKGKHLSLNKCEENSTL